MNTLRLTANPQFSNHESFSTFKRSRDDEIYGTNENIIKDLNLDKQDFHLTKRWEKWAFTLSPPFSKVCYQVVKQVLIANLDSIILFLFLKWTISEMLLPLKYDLVLSDTMVLHNCARKQYCYFSTLFASLYIQLSAFVSIPFNIFPFYSPKTIIFVAWKMCFYKSKQANYTNRKLPHHMSMGSTTEIPVKTVTQCNSFV